MVINKKKFIIYIAIFSACLIMLSLVCSCDKKADESYNPKDYVIDMPYKENFQVLQLSDTHWKGGTDWTEGENFIKKVVNNSKIPGGKPDLIVITGDCVNYGTYDDWKNYCDFFDSLQVPWTLMFGNHDARAFLSLEGLTSMLNERSKSSNSYLKFVNNINDPVYGDSNFAINLKDGDKIKEQLIIFDSNRYRSEAVADGYKNGDDCTHTDQVMWYKKLVNWTTEQNGGKIVPSLAFFHMPMQEYLFAYESVLRGENKFLDEGGLEEKICCSRENCGLFDAMLELGSTKATFCGHDHINNFNVDYKGIKLVYGIKSSTNNYHNKEWLGGRLITLKDDGNYDMTLIRENY